MEAHLLFVQWVFEEKKAGDNTPYVTLSMGQGKERRNHGGRAGREEQGRRRTRSKKTKGKKPGQLSLFWESVTLFFCFAPSQLSSSSTGHFAAQRRH
jgi:hypothetical protein